MTRPCNMLDVLSFPSRNETYRSPRSRGRYDRYDDVRRRPPPLPPLTPPTPPTPWSSSSLFAFIVTAESPITPLRRHYRDCGDAVASLFIMVHRLFFCMKLFGYDVAKMGFRRVDGGGTTSRLSSWAFWREKNKFDQNNSYETVYRENVPEKPLRIHHDIQSSIISDSSFATMGIFP